MPLVKCSKNGASGWKWGHNNNSCFTGPHGKRDAIKQAIVIEGGPEKFKKAIKSEGSEIIEEFEQAVAELIDEGKIDRYDYFTEAYISKKDKEEKN